MTAAARVARTPVETDATSDVSPTFFGIRISVRDGGFRLGFRLGIRVSVSPTCPDARTVSHILTIILYIHFKDQRVLLDCTKCHNLLENDFPRWIHVIRSEEACGDGRD